MKKINVKAVLCALLVLTQLALLAIPCFASQETSANANASNEPSLLGDDLRFFMPDAWNENLLAKPFKKEYATHAAAYNIAIPAEAQPDISGSKVAYLAYKLKNLSEVPVEFATRLVLWCEGTAQAGASQPAAYDAVTGEKADYTLNETANRITSTARGITVAPGAEVYIVIPMTTLAGEQAVASLPAAENGNLIAKDDEVASKLQEHYESLEDAEKYITLKSFDIYVFKKDADIIFEVTDCHVMSMDKYVSRCEKTDSPATYNVGENWISYLQAEDSDYVTLDESGAWEVTENSGAIGGKALTSKAATQAFDGSKGISLRVKAPADGTYQIWGRVYYTNQAASTLSYTVDGAPAAVWSLIDADATDAACYGAWYYFYLTVETDGKKHTPNALNLTAGDHEIVICASAEGFLLDEFVISTYTVAEYDPNAFEGNTKQMTDCKLCSGETAHFCSDVYAETEETAESYFVRALHSDAQKTQAPVADPKPIISEGEENNGENGSNTENSGNTGNSGNTDNNGNTGNTNNSTNNGTNNQSTTTNTPTVEEEKGCGSAIGGSAILLIAMLGLGGTVLSKKRKNS